MSPIAPPAERRLAVSCLDRLGTSSRVIPRFPRKRGIVPRGGTASSHFSLTEPVFRPELTRLIEIGAMGAVFVLYALLKARTLEIVPSDEGVYYYAAKIWLEGAMPYRDFFISHPPVHLLEAAIPIAFFGMNFYLLNAIPGILLSSLNGFLTFRIAARAWGFVPGFLASVLFLFSANHLFQSNHMTGINLALTFLLGGVNAYLGASSHVTPSSPERCHPERSGAESKGEGRRDHTLLLSGMLFGLGTMTGAYVLPGFALLCGLSLLRSPRDLRPLLKGWALMIVPLHLLFLSLAGTSFIEDVYLYHMHKLAQSAYFASTATTIVAFVREERHIALLALLGLHGVLLAREPLAPRLGLKGHPLATLCLLLALDYLLFYSYQSRVFRHYLLLALPFATIAGVYGIHTLSQAALSPPRLSARWCLQGGVALATVGLLAWAPLSAIAPFGNISVMTAFTKAHDVALSVKNALAPGETLYGEFGITPVIALLSGIPIAGNEVDSSIMRFEGNPAPFSDTLSKIEADRVGGVLLRPTVDIYLHPPFREYLTKYYVLEKTFTDVDVQGMDIEFWRRNGEEFKVF